MFFNKKPSAPATAELVPEKGFGLFVNRVKAAPVTAQPFSPSRLPALDVTDVIDVADVQPVTSALRPAPPPYVPREPVPTPPPPPRAQEPAAMPARPASLGPAVNAFAGLKVKKREDAGPAEPTALGVPAQPLDPVEPVAATTVTAPSKATKMGFGGLFATRGKPSLASTANAPAAKAPPQPKPPKAAKELKIFKPKAGKKVGDRLHQGADVLVELEGGREVFWRVSATGIKEIASTEAHNAISFTKNDLHFAVPQAMRDGAASDLVLAEVGEPVRIINVSRSQNAVYATPVARVLQLAPMRIAPGLLLLEQLLKVEREADEPLLCGLVLQDAQTGRGLVVLYYVNSAGDVSAVQVTANVDNVNFVLSQFAATNRLDLAATKAVLFKNEDLLKVASHAQYFPLEAEYFGVSLSKLTTYTALVALVAATGLGTYAAQAYTQKVAVQARLNSAKTRKIDLQNKLDSKLLSSVKSFSVTQSIVLTQSSARANKLWVAGAKVVLEATPAKETYIVTMPLTRPGVVAGNPTLLGQVSTQDVSPLLKSEPIEGCVRSAPAISGGLNALQITISCENNPSLFSSYWPS